MHRSSASVNTLTSCGSSQHSCCGFRYKLATGSFAIRCNSSQRDNHFSLRDYSRFQKPGSHIWGFRVFITLLHASSFHRLLFGIFHLPVQNQTFYFPMMVSNKSRNFLYSFWLFPYSRISLCLPAVL